MAVDISITSNILDAAMEMKNYSNQVVVQSARKAINRSLTTGRKLSRKSLRERLNIKNKDIGNKSRKMRIQKARGGRMASLTGSLEFETTPLPMLMFIKGKKTPIKQRGVKLRKRRKLKAEVYRGKKLNMAPAFIQKVRTTQVFRRQASGKLHRQSAPSVGEFMKRKVFFKNPRKGMLVMFNRTLNEQIKFRSSAQASRLNKAKMKKIL